MSDHLRERARELSTRLYGCAVNERVDCIEAAFRAAEAAERERCAKIATNFHKWAGSADIAHSLTKEWIAAAIRGDQP